MSLHLEIMGNYEEIEGGCMVYDHTDLDLQDPEGCGEESELNSKRRYRCVV